MTTQQPHQWAEQIAAAESKLPVMYAEFARNYVAANLSPTNPELQRILQHNIDQLKQEQTALADMDTDIKLATARANAAINGAQHRIELEQKTRDDLHRILTPVASATHASQTRIDDYREQYRNQLISNILFIVAITFCVSLIFQYGGYGIAAPSWGYALAAFVVYLLFVVIYVYRYGISRSYTFYFVMAPFMLFAVGLFVRRSSPS